MVGGEGGMVTRGDGWGGGGIGLVAPSFGTDSEMNPKCGGGDKQSQKSGDLPIPLNSGVVGHL